jgi:EAL domain-containing protein (putative c-di-GMP-specific phosphodiesterase class I)
MVPPDEFIALAEETGLILPIGRWILAEACRQARAWRDRQSSGLALEMCVNVSARQFVHPELVAEVAGVLQETGLDPRCLVLEITESTMMDDAERNAATLRDLTDLGVRLAIDDFGTGYSSLAYLHRFPVDVLKIDRSFVDGLGRESEDTAIVRAVIGLARSLRLEVVAEGVETAEQSARLRALGCRYAQGYLFSEPLRSEEVEALLRSASLQGMSARGGNAARPAP